MTPPASDFKQRSAQKQVARKYRTLGYEVLENPGPEVLPDFMRGMAPDIVARSGGDNVVIEVKTHASLRGSNTLVDIAKRVTGHPEWRVELIVPDDVQDAGHASDFDYGRVSKMVDLAFKNKLFEMAFVYVGTTLVQIGRDLARSRGMSSANKTDRSIFLDLGFKGVLPDNLLEQSLTVLTRRDELMHGAGQTSSSTDQEVRGALQLCEELRALL